MFSTSLDVKADGLLLRVVTRKMRENAHFLLAREWVFFEAFEEHRDSDRTCSGALVTKLSAFISKISEWRNARMRETKEMYPSWSDDHGVRLGNVKIKDLHDFKEHPFHVVEDMALFELTKSIEDKGVIVPLIVRANPYGDGYEIKCAYSIRISKDVRSALESFFEILLVKFKISRFKV